MDSGVRRYDGIGQLVAFFALAYAVSWALWSPWVLLGEAAAAPGLGYAAGYGPWIAALLVTWASGGSQGPLMAQVFHWRVGLHWYAVALLLPAALLLAGLGLLAAVGGPVDASPTPDWHRVPFLLALHVVLGGGQEEPGWRGFALPRLQARLGALGGSLVLGLLWALWHLPLFFVPDSAQSAWNISFPMYTAFVVALSVSFTWLYNSSGGSVLMAMLFHAAINTTSIWYPIAAGTLPQVLMVAGFWLVAGVLVAIYGRRLGVRRKESGR